MKKVNINRIIIIFRFFIPIYSYILILIITNYKSTHYTVQLCPTYNTLCCGTYTIHLRNSSIFSNNLPIRCPFLSIIHLLPVSKSYFTWGIKFSKQCFTLGQGRIQTKITGGGEFKGYTFTH
jgi:hypothetical protein